MWVMTTSGFFSAVRDRHNAECLLVRARCKADIDALAQLTRAKPWMDECADYAWRVRLTDAEWADALVALAAGITYPNFKNAVASDAHHAAYSRVWGVMLSLDDRAPRESIVWGSDVALWDDDLGDWPADAFDDD